MENFVYCRNFDEMIFDSIFLYYYFLIIFSDHSLIERYVIRFENFFRVSDLIYSGFF
jgi:hypothetical protein